jgi:fused signal recognition particle receptor
MDELKRIKRALQKAADTAAGGRTLTGVPHEVLLVIDGTNGQNALAQVRAFDEAIGLTGLVITKLDGTAKGGVLAALARERRAADKQPIPIYFIGVGEKLDDLQPFVAKEFAEALIG